MAEQLEQDKRVADLVTDLQNAALIPAKQRAIKISGVVERVCSHAYEDGLSNHALEKLIDILTQPNELDQGTAGNLIKNLYPASKIPNEIIIKVVGSLGHGRAKPSYTSQAALLKWLIMVYDVIENQKVLSHFYGILFNLLDTLSIRTQICHLLSLVTRRKHIRLFRIQVLMELTRQAGNDPPLVGLMRVYKDYYPDVIVGDTTAGRASVFTHPNKEWHERLNEIQEIYFQRTQETLPLEQRAFRVNRKSTSRKYASVIPEVRTSHAQESSITLEEIDNVDDFVRHLDRIELPNQLVSVIGDPLLQKFLQLKYSETTSRRINNWLLAFFEDQLEASQSNTRNVLDMLRAIREYARFTKRLPSGCLTYLKSMIPSWDGLTGRDIILDLLAFVHIAPFEVLYHDFFEPLEDAILDDAADSKLVILTFYNNLLRRWGTALMSPDSQSVANQAAVTSLINHGNTLALTTLQSSISVSACSSALTFYETIACVISHPDLKATIRIIVPPSELVYTLYFTLSLSILTRLCSILALYKRAFEYATSAKSANVNMQPYPKEEINHFNGFLMDICNCVWRSRAFNATDVNALGCLLPAGITSALTTYISALDTSISLAGLFSLSYSPVLCWSAISYVRVLEDGEDTIDIRHAGPVTQGSLKQLEIDGGLILSWADYRLGVLRYLENNRAPGVAELMYNTMKHLMTARESTA